MDKPVSYFQTDRRWAANDYSAPGESTTIAKSGCGPTSMAMVLASWADAKVTPETECAWALEHGYKAAHQGTYYSYFVPAGKRYGLTVERINTVNIYGQTTSAALAAHDKAAAALANGDLVIACMGVGNWTTSGHYVLCWKLSGNTIYINDPASTRKTRTEGDYALFKTQVKYYWIVRHPDAQKEDNDMMTQEQFNQMADKYICGLADKPPAEWSEDARKWAEQLGIIQGDSQGRMQYKAPCTREQMVVFLKRLADKLEK